MLRAVRKNIVDTIASRHIAGKDVVDVLPICRWAHEHGYKSIVSPWAGPDDPPRKVFDRYKEAFDSMHNETIDWYLSIKLESIGNDIGLFQELSSIAKSNGVRLHLDSMGPDSAPFTYSFLEKTVAQNPNLGCTLPSRWTRSITDADRAVDLGVSIRIVKGQWQDPGQAKVDSRKNYLAIVERLAGRARHVAVATHDARLAERALGLLSAADTHCELEQFFSLPLTGINLVQKSGYSYRLYVAYGHPGVPYNVRVALSRPGMIAWIITDFAVRPKKPWTGDLKREKGNK